jgi:hypothetical protein
MMMDDMPRIVLVLMMMPRDRIVSAREEN